MSLSVFASLGCLGSFCSPFRCTTTPTTGSALQKGPRRGVLPPTHAELHRRNREERASWTLKRTAELHSTLSQFEKLCTVAIDSIFFSNMWIFFGWAADVYSFYSLSAVILTWSHLMKDGCCLNRYTFTLRSQLVSFSLEIARTYCFLKLYHLYWRSSILC